MSKAILVMDMPINCFECPFKYKSEEMPLGNFTYQSLFRCKYEPEDICEDEGDIVYLNNIMFESKPNWCPLKEVPQKAKYIADDTICENAAKIGYNACIDTILKGSE